MKKVLLSAATLALSAVMLFTACNTRQPKDLTGATTIADLNGAIIAAQTGTFHYDDALQQITGAEKKGYDDFTALLVALQSKAIDGYIAEEPTAYSVTAENPELTYIPFKNNQTGFTAGEEDTGIAIGFKKGSSLTALADQALSLVTEQSKQQLMQDIVAISADPDTAYGKDITLIASSIAENGGVLKVAMECGYKPFNWTQTTNANGAVAISGKNNLYANGYDVQIAKYIAASLGMTLEVYEYEWESLIPAVQSSTVDAIIAGMSPTAERKEEIDFTQCYYVSNLVVIINKNV